MAERKRRPTREELDERLRFVLGKIPVSVIDGERPEPEVTPVAVAAPTPEPTNVVDINANGNGSGNANPHESNGAANGNGRIVGGRITAAGEG